MIVSELHVIFTRGGGFDYFLTLTKLGVVAAWIVSTALYIHYAAQGEFLEGPDSNSLFASRFLC